MTMHPLLRQWQKRLRRRALVEVLVWAPLVLVTTVFLISRFASADSVIASICAAAAVLVFLLVRAWSAVDASTAVRRLDALSGEVEDSTDLLLDRGMEISPLQMLQRERVLTRFGQFPSPRVPRTPLPRFVLPLAGVLGVLVLASLILRADDNNPAGSIEPATAEAITSAPIVIVSAQIEIEAPAYTGLPSRKDAALETKAAEGSLLRWTIRFEPDPETASLDFHDENHVALTHDADGWHAETRLSESTLYRIGVSGASALAEDRLYRLDAIVDQAPQIKVTAPDKTLTELAAGQRQWPLDFEVADDYGIGDAKLVITLAQGSGEQVKVSEHSESLRADKGGDVRHRRYRRQLDLVALGFAEGDDLIVRLIVTDNRHPAVNETRSAGYILRWLADPGSDSEGVDGIVQKVLPAYFRSQRQIIIDTEALIDEKPNLAADRFMARADSIGVDQKILRLRYGQFLGEEFESGSHNEHAPADSRTDKPAQQDALAGDHDHEAGAETDAGFGKEANILAEFGHTHDHAEAATLLDPATRKILKSALSEMWQAELHLRQGEPRKALPFENRALDFIKQVQQSTRIYLARVGLELPPVDESRRLSGERKGIRDVHGALVEADQNRKIISDAYQLLAAGSSVDLDALVAWLRSPATALPDSLGLIAAIDELRRQPDCATCRLRLLDQLWPRLPNPPTVSRTRKSADESGRRYLDSLQKEAQP